MAKGIIGRPFTFTALFLNADGDPIAVNSPSIEVFYYTTNGVKVSVVAAGTVLPESLPVETGRYAYNLDPIPATLDTSLQLYGVMKGTNPTTSTDIVIEQAVDLFAQDAITGGLQTHFINPAS